MIDRIAFSQFISNAKSHLLKLLEALSSTLGVLFGGPSNAEGPMETSGG